MLLLPFVRAIRFRHCQLTSLEGITGTWSPAWIILLQLHYTFTPDAGQCATPTTLTITVNPIVTPTFARCCCHLCGRCYFLLCQQLQSKALQEHGARLWIILLQLHIPLPLMPASVLLPATLTITVNPKSLRHSTPLLPYLRRCMCFLPLPTTSLEGITGTWSPALDNTATTTYTFTPDAGQCATTDYIDNYS